MGLDVYVGTLTRYLTGDWELVTEKAAREAGIEFEVIRTAPDDDDAITDSGVVRQAVHDWRAALSASLCVPLSWSEDDEQPYFTDKPDWSGYLSLLLLAAHDLSPDIALPTRLPDDVWKHALLEVISPPRRRLFGRRRSDVDAARYSMLWSCEVWLPVDLDDAWAGPFITGHEMRFGSVSAFQRQLRNLADSIGATDNELADWRQSGGGGAAVETVAGPDGLQIERRTRGAPKDEGRFGLAVFLELASRAVEHGLPMKLDY